ncbi:MAG TPA: hypothetical protein ENK49_11210 [Gammaproteobacteria bacterium]|nr:hypothetical protein [Gammaproteobacteria bacterium]
MKDPLHHDPLDALGEAYEKMFERAAKRFHEAEKKSGPVFHKLIDEAKDKAIELKELSEEDAERLAAYIKRDLGDVASHLSETGNELSDWLGFETALLESAIFDLLLKAADPTTLTLLKINEDARQAASWHTGEITGPGTLVCDQCGEKLHFRKAGKIPPCPKCHATTFHR